MRTFPPVTLLLLLAVAACFKPNVSGYLAVPIEPIAGQDLPWTVVAVPLSELSVRGIDAEDMAVYHKGRAPIPHLLTDTDGDGSFDTVWVRIDVPEEGTILTFLSPGPRADGLPPLPAATVEVDLLWREAYR